MQKKEENGILITLAPPGSMNLAAFFFNTRVIYRLRCPYRGPCMPGKNWKKPLEQRYKNLTVSKEFERLRAKSQERVQSEEGKKLRMNRSIQVEGSFGDIKANSGFTRFLCRGTEAVFAESTLFAMAHNLGWLHSRIQNDKQGEHLYALKKDSKETL